MSRFSFKNGSNKIIFISYVIVILVLSLGVSYAINYKPNSTDIKGSIVYVDESLYDDLEFDSNDFELTPILDRTVNDNNKYVINLNFLVGGSKDNNIDNIIYDISLVNLELDCELLSPYLKWRLIKNEEVISEGSLDYRFDTIKDGRLVLTPIQQDLKDYSEDKSNYDEYNFYMWLSDSCQEDSLINCKNVVDQRNLIKRKIKGQINVELSVGAKSPLVRNPINILNTDTCMKEMEDED